MRPDFAAAAPTAAAWQVGCHQRRHGPDCPSKSAPRQEAIASLGDRVYARSVSFTARALRGLAAACVMASLTIAVPGVASAHTSLKDSTPKDESTVTSELDIIELEFTDDVTDPRVEVLDAGGQNHADGEVVLDGAMVQQAVGGLESGEYVVAYQVVSADGDPVSGTITFTLDLPEPTPEAQPSTEESRPRPQPLPLPRQKKRTQQHPR